MMGFDWWLKILPFWLGCNWPPTLSPDKATNKKASPDPERLFCLLRPA
jgi:hypothetical protein